MCLIKNLVLKSLFLLVNCINPKSYKTLIPKEMLKICVKCFVNLAPDSSLNILVHSL